MQTIKNWQARRAGGRITIYGKNEQGGEMKIVGVDQIKGPGPAGGLPIATDKNGTDYALA